MPFTISKKGDKIKNVLTQKVISLKQNIEADIIEQEDLRDYKMYHEVFCAKSSAVLSKTLGYDVKVLQTETAITGSYTGLKNQNP